MGTPTYRHVVKPITAVLSASRFIHRGVLLQDRRWGNGNGRNETTLKTLLFPLSNSLTVDGDLERHCSITVSHGDHLSPFVKIGHRHVVDPLDVIVECHTIDGVIVAGARKSRRQDSEAFGLNSFDEKPIMDRRMPRAWNEKYYWLLIV